MATQTNNTPTGWVGWSFFAGFMMMLLGGMEAIAGLAAIFKSGFYVTPTHLLILDYRQWGWIALLLGIIIFFAGLELFRGAMWARVIAVFLAGLSFLANMAFVNAYPIWSIIMMVVNVLIIYAVLIHGGELKDV